MAKKDYYEVLGLEKNASETDIKKAYKNKAKKLHPDAGGDKEAFQEVAEAYEVLSDASKKANYDRFGHDKQSPQMPRYERQVRKGPNLSVTIKLTLEEIYSGVNKKLKYNRQASCQDCDGHGGLNQHTCSNCGGNGMVIQTYSTPMGHFRSMEPCSVCDGNGELYTDTCNTCKGTGSIIKEENIDFNIQSGVSEGMNFIMHGNGSHVKHSIAGDLVIKIMELPHNVFIRSGDDLKMNLKLTYPQLVLGDKIEIDTIDGGRIRVTIPPHSKVGTNLRVPKKGLKNFNTGNSGELILILDIIIPTTISDEEKSLIEKLKEVKLALN